MRLQSWLRRAFKPAGGTIALPVGRIHKVAMKLATRIVEKPWGRIDLPRQFARDDGRRIGEIWYQMPDGSAPLDVMIKYLFTSERLSIQVHPNDDQARAAGYPRGKEEAWVVLDAEPDAHIGIGLVRDADADELRAAALDGSIEALIDWRPARAGDIWYNPAGTIHAIGPGLVVAEVQQAVDLTYRLYDYGRPRELHLDAGLAVALGRPHADPRDGRLPDHGSALLVTGPYFGLAWCDGALPPLPADAVAPFQIVPVNGPTSADGAVILPGECGMAATAAGVALAQGSTALLAWSIGEQGA